MLPEETSSSAQPEGQPERFLEAVTAPLVKNVEHQHAAKNVLRAMVLNAGALSDATRRMEDKSFKWKRWLLPLVGLAVVLVFAIPSLWQMVKMIYAQETHYSLMWGGERRTSIPLIKPDVFQTSRLSADEKIILLGDEDALTEEDRLKAIVYRFPDRPEFYAEYAKYCLRTNKKLPADFDATVARIDPENGYFSYLKSIEVGMGCASSSRGGALHFFVRDGKRLLEANSWIHRAVVASSFTSYRKNLNERRSMLLPHAEDIMTALLIKRFHQSYTWRDDLQIEWQGLFPLAELERLGKPGNEERFRLLLDDFRKLQSRLLEDAPFQSEMLSDPSKLPGAVELCAGVAETKALDPERTHFRELDDWLVKNPSPHRYLIGPSSASPTWEHMMRSCSSLHRVRDHRFRLIKDEILPSNEALAPGRFAEHALWGRAASLMGVGLLAALAWLMFLYRFRHGRLPRLVTHSLKKAMRPWDYAWILLLGVGLPLLWHQAVRQSPWGGLDFNLEHGIEKQILPQWGLLALMVLMATTLAVRWRVKRRLRGIDLGIGRSAFTWICLLLTAATMPLMRFWVEDPSLPDESMLVAGAVPALWLVVSLTRGLFMPVESIFGQLLVSRVTATSWLLASVVFAACAPIYYQVERHWVARDTLLQSPDFPNALEKMVAAEMNREDLELLERMGK